MSKTSKTPEWYAISATPAAADVMIYDVVGQDTTARDFIGDLKSVTAPVINLHINTPGGRVTEGVAIYNALKEHPARVVAHIDGIAASIGSFIAMAGDEIRMNAGSFMMIHNPAVAIFGGSEDLRRHADVLDKMTGTLARTYAARTGKPEAEVRQLMADETWFTAEEAVAAGFADSVTPEKARMVAFAGDAHANFTKTPDALRALWHDTPSANPGHATQPPRRSGGAPAAQQENQPMNAEAFSKYAAENPEAAEVKNLVARGHKTGESAGEAAAKARLREIIAACPGKLDLAVNTFLAGGDADGAKATASAVDAALAQVSDQIKAKDEEIARLRAAASAPGGSAPLNLAPEGEQRQTADDANVADPEAHAKAEWAGLTADAKARWISEAVYVKARAKEIRKAQR